MKSKGPLRKCYELVEGMDDGSKRVTEKNLAMATNYCVVAGKALGKSGVDSKIRGRLYEAYRALFTAWAAVTGRIHRPRGDASKLVAEAFWQLRSAWSYVEAPDDR